MIKKNSLKTILLNQVGGSRIETIIEAGIILSEVSSLVYLGIYKFQWFKWKHVGYTVAILLFILILLSIWGIYLDRKERKNDERD